MELQRQYHHNPATHLLEVENLSIKFRTDEGDKTVVNGISFKMKRGETIGIVGESGSGKTVTSLSLMRLITGAKGMVQKGKIFLESERLGRIEISSTSSKEMRQVRGQDVSMIFQEPMSSLNPVYTCGNQVMEAVLFHKKVSKKEAKKETLDLFAQVKLKNPERIFSSYPHQISGGEKQRVMIAIALSCDPVLLIADEPTTALDVTVQAAILDILRELRDKKNMGLIFITHDLGVISQIADKVLVMYKGRIVEEGNVLKIFEDPQHPYTKGLLACRPRTDIKLKVLPTVDDFMVEHSGTDSAKKGEAKFSSVGWAILQNYQSESESREQHDKLKAQKPILEVKNLSIHFPKKKNWYGKVTELNKAVNEVSFNVYPGETLGLVGESGCGKSTLAKSIIRLVDAQSGEVIYRGQNILTIPPKQLRTLRKDIQIIFQDPYSSLNPRMTIGEAILEPMRMHNIMKNDRDRKEAIIELLEMVNLSGEHFYRYPHQFSGGQRQRICIARALAVKPRFVICDESVSALDVSVQAQVLNLLNRLKEKYNLTYIFISHDLAVVRFIADRIIVMNKGKIEETGWVEDIYQRPKSPYTQKLIDAIPSADIEDIRHRMIERKLTKR